MNATQLLLHNIRIGSIQTRDELDRAKKRVGKQFGLSNMVANSDIIALMSDNELDRFRALLQRKPSRKASGVSVVAVMTKPSRCPHGRCTFCPGGEKSVFGDVPQSYTGKEPASMRGAQHHYDPYAQVFSRLKQYYDVGHVPSKIELIIMGGTFLSYEDDYKQEFITRCFQALNEFPHKQENKRPSLENVQLANETAKHRCVSLVVETKPDWLDVEEVMRYGATRVEIGVQCLRNDVLKSTQRGHDLNDVWEATKKLKDAGLKCDYHMMLKLPGMSKDEDIMQFKTLFEDERYQPDGLKMYPTLVIRGTVLYKLFEQGRYEPADDAYVIDVLSKAKTFLPEYVRVKRIMRDIPTTQVFKGPRAGNIREQIWKRMKTPCRCIRCREIGRNTTHTIVPELRVKSYAASGGTDYFISINDKASDSLIGFARLRISPAGAFIRELHVYGSQTPVGDEGVAFQHKGFGKQLMAKAEELAKKNSAKKLRVVSGVGVREYYRTLGYTRDGPYMTKYF